VVVLVRFAVIWISPNLYDSRNKITEQVAGVCGSVNSYGLLDNFFESTNLCEQLHP